MLQVAAGIILAYILIVTWPAALWLGAFVIFIWLVSLILLALGKEIGRMFPNKKTPAEDK